MSNEHEVLVMERAALARWCNGDPDGFLEISAPDVVYFDPFHERRLNNFSELKNLYDGLKGGVQTDNFELIDPVVTASGDMAALSFNFVSVSGGKPNRWNCTEVYRRGPEGWRIIQTHWSLTGVGQALVQAGLI